MIDVNSVLGPVTGGYIPSIASSPTMPNMPTIGSIPSVGSGLDFQGNVLSSKPTIPPVEKTVGYKISITQGSNVVILEASSPLDESRSAHYEVYNIMHLPTDILTYKNTSSRTFSISAKLVSRNSSEASMNSRYIDLIRSWVLPGFGTNGATPPIVKLNAFNNRNIKNIQCVIESYSIHYPDDVDWVFDGADPMPVIGTMTISLKETWTPAQISAGKAWQIEISPAGKFINGAAFKNNSADVGSSQTPPFSLLTGDGIASGALPLTSSTGTNNNAANFGITSSNLISDKSAMTTTLNNAIAAGSVNGVTSMTETLNNAAAAGSAHGVTYASMTDTLNAAVAAGSANGVTSNYSRNPLEVFNPTLVN